MKVLQINSTNSFNGLYKIDRNYIGDHTESFILNNEDVIHSEKRWDNDVFVLTPDNKDEEFEQCIKQDNGKYWKSKPLSQLMRFPGFLEEIFRINYVSNDSHAEWVDYTENTKSSAEDEIPF